MAASHSYSAFKNRCVTPPRDPRTNLPVTLHEKETKITDQEYYEKKKDHNGEPYYCVKGVALRGYRESLLRKKSDSLRGDVDNISIPEQASDEGGKRQEIGTAAETALNPANLASLLNDDKKFYSHLRALKMENKKTLKILDRLYNSYNMEDGEVTENGSFIPCPQEMKQAWSGEEIYDRVVQTSTFSEHISHPDTTDKLRDFDLVSGNVLGENEENQEDSSSENDDSRFDFFHDWRVKKAAPPPNILPERGSDWTFRGRHSSYEVIDTMWDQFSVDEYAPYEKSPDLMITVQNKWEPKITIPKPFNMTLRENLQARERAERRTKVERELMQKSLDEEAELKKKFKAQPLPATTYLPLYEELKTQEEERREKTRSLSKAVLQSKVQPFSFTKREEAMKEIRKYNMSGKRKNSKNGDKQLFKAKPFPEKLFDLTIEDKRAEQEEYRKIKMQMRSQELLASASLPPNMKARGEKYAVRRQEKLKKYMKKEKAKFQPTVNHDIPDFELLQKKFENELMRKRKENQTTHCQPFDLHTAKIPSRRTQNLLHSMEETINRSNLSKKKSKSVDSFNVGASSQTLTDSIPYSVTESTRLRQSAVQRSLDAKVKEQENQRAKEMQKKKRERELGREVSRKSIANDLKRIMKTQTEEKLREFKRADTARQREYREQLRDLRAKLEQRPLLFEQESHLNARRKAEKRYQQILMEAGVEPGIVDDLVSSEVNDDETESTGGSEDQGTMALHYSEDNEESKDSGEHRYSDLQIDSSGVIENSRDKRLHITKSDPEDSSALARSDDEELVEEDYQSEYDEEDDYD